MAAAVFEKAPSLILKSFSLPFGVQAFKALGDETRLRILHILLHFEELSITDLELILDFTQTKVARQMGVLKNASLVQCRRIDHWVLYKIKDEAHEFLNGLLTYIEKEPQIQKDKSICEVLHSNRELSVNKISLKQYKPQQS